MLLSWRFPKLDAWLIPGLILLFCGALSPACAQYEDASSLTQGYVSLTAPWRFQPGDDQQWASPQFDDSNWPLLQSDKTWNYQGYKGYYGYAWYRLRVKLPQTGEPLAVNTGHINSAAELYVDGQLVGANGIMRPKPDWSRQLSANCIPLPPGVNGRTVELALRVWKSPIASSYSGGGWWTHPQLGTLSALDANQQLSRLNELVDNGPEVLVDVLEFVLGMFSLCLFFMQRRSTEYAWFAIYAMGFVAIDLIPLVLTAPRQSVTFWDGDLPLLTGPVFIAFLLFVWRSMRARLDWLFYIGAGLACLAPIAACLSFHNVYSLALGQSISTVCEMLVDALFLVRVTRTSIAGNWDARLLLGPLVLLSLDFVIEGARQAIFWAGLSRERGPIVLWSSNGITVYWNTVLTALFLISVAGVLLLRFTKAAAREERLTAEMQAAGQVQAQLVPAHLPSTPHFTFDAAYFAAGEVGGDFYLVDPQADGSVLVAIGDVSGKGLKAAMLGTLVVGAMRSLSRQSLKPSTILSRLNEQLTASSDGGFVTCLVLHLAADGNALSSNAGHLAPYSGGEEVALESGLPLGVTAHAEYFDAALTLEPGETLTLLSDGVVEAQSPTGELFGFDRTKSISSQPASKIAEAARRFGQQDDITVLKVTLLPSIDVSRAVEL
jgi:hypothetical protein